MVVLAVSEGPKVGQLAGLPTDGATGRGAAAALHGLHYVGTGEAGPDAALLTRQSPRPEK